MREPALRSIYTMLRNEFGFLDWWPGDTKLEVVVGAVLTQQTSWKNVEKAIGSIKAANAMNLEKLAGMRLPKLESLIRSSGFYRQKARRLKGLLASILEYGGIENFFSADAEELRKRLLEMNGIGKETADSIILYAAEKPVFVVDAYTKRILSRVYGIDENISYDELKGTIEHSIGRNLELYKDFHAQFVELGKRYCKTKPLCPDCPLAKSCKYSLKLAMGKTRGAR